MPPATTIKVPKTLHDRIATRARREHVTLAAAIERALDEADEQEFWVAVHNENSALTDDEREARLPNATLGDGLTNADDDALTDEDAW